MLGRLCLLLSGCVALLFACLLTRHYLVPEVVPIAWAETPQPLWAVEATFFLRSAEFILLPIAVVVLFSILWISGQRYLRNANGIRRGAVQEFDKAT